MHEYVASLAPVGALCLAVIVILPIAAALLRPKGRHRA